MTDNTITIAAHEVLIKRAVEAEREACARVCQKHGAGTPDDCCWGMAEGCADEIRARGNS